MVFSDMKEEKAAEFAEIVKEQIVPLLKTRNLYLLVLEVPQRVSAVCQKLSDCKKNCGFVKMENEEDTTRTYASMGVNRLLFNIEIQTALKNIIRILSNRWMNMMR